MGQFGSDLRVQIGNHVLAGGVAALVLLMFPRGFQFERKASSDAEAEKEAGGWLIFLALSLVV